MSQMPIKSEAGEHDYEIDLQPNIKPDVKRKRATTALDDSTSDADDANVKPAKGARGKKWTSAELEALLMAAVRGSVPLSVFQGAVPGRTAHQCDMTWRGTLLPRLKRLINDDMGNGVKK
jgi:hypothetical protein